METWKRQFLAFMTIIWVGNAVAEYVYENSQGHISIPVSRIPTTVENLYLQSNKISDIDWFPAYTALRYLNLKGNILWEFPALMNVSLTLKDLDLSYNNISIISYDRLDNLTSLEKLSLAGNVLTAEAIPGAEGPSLTLHTLNLQENILSRVPLLITLCKNLNNIYLSKNNIKSIIQSDFENITDLRNLYASENAITEVEFLPQGLVVLDLSKNQLSSSPPLQNMTSLKTLNLANNAIICIDADDLQDLKSLKSLKLQNNQLNDSCIPDVEGPTETLSELLLGGNEFSRFPGWLHLGQNLTKLNLDHNTISQLTDADLDGFPKLKLLYLSYNNISEFPVLSKNGPQLVHLSLYGNNIDSLTLDDLEPLKDCPYLNLGHNNLEEIPEFCYAEFEIKFTLLLRHNPLQCDTRLMWGLAAQYSNHDLSLDVTNTPCAGPSLLQGQLVHTIPLPLMENRGEPTFIRREYFLIEPPFSCYMKVTKVQENESMLRCGMLCSLSDECLMYGFNATDVSLANPEGTCAITSLYGAPINTTQVFQWYAPPL